MCSSNLGTWRFGDWDNLSQPRSSKEKKGNPNLTPKYCWKRDNPDSEDFILAKCAAVNYRRAQHLKEYIYEDDIKEGLCSKLQKSPARERIHIRRGY